MCTVSVIIPNYNHALFLKQRIDSVLSQTFQDFELIILDDNSTDNSRLIIEEYRKNPKVSHIVYNENNSGSTFIQWEKGMEYATGKFIWIAESDDVADEGFLASMMRLFDNKTNCILATARTAHIDEAGKIHGINLWPDELDDKRWNVRFVNDGIDEIIQYLRFRNTIPNASAVVFRNDVEAELRQLLLKDWKYNGDWYFWAALLKKGSIAYCSVVLNYQRFHYQTTRSVKLFESEEKRFLETVEVIRSLAAYSRRKINWFDSRYDWLFIHLTKRIKFKNKLNSRYFCIGRSLHFGVRLLWENVKFYLTKNYKTLRFEGGAYKQKVYTFLRNSHNS